MEYLSSSNTCQGSHFLYYTHAAEERPNLWSSHLCGSPSTPVYGNTLIQLCRFMSIWNQTISYTLLEYLQGLCLGRLDPNRRCHLFCTVLISYVGQVELIACQRTKSAPPTCGFRQATHKNCRVGFTCTQSDILSCLQDPVSSASGMWCKRKSSSLVPKAEQNWWNVILILMIWFFVCTSLITIKELWWPANTYICVSELMILQWRYICDISVKVHLFQLSVFYSVFDLELSMPIPPVPSFCRLLPLEY